MMEISETKMQMVIANYFKDECDVNTSIRQAFEKGFRIGVKKGASMNKPQEWIPCSERLPEEEGIYLVTATNYIFDAEEIAVGTCYFNIEYGFSNNRKIIAWMPLPKPWKGSDDE